MRISTLNEINQERNYIQSFNGYNHNTRIPENEFYEMDSLCGENYPTISPRKSRGYWLTRYDYGLQTGSYGVSGLSVSKDGFYERVATNKIPLRTYTFRYGDLRWGNVWKLQNTDESWSTVNISGYGISFDSITDTPAQIDVTPYLKDFKHIYADVWSGDAKFRGVTIGGVQMMQTTFNNVQLELNATNTYTLACGTQSVTGTLTKILGVYMLTNESNFGFSYIPITKTLSIVGTAAMFNEFSQYHATLTEETENVIPAAPGHSYKALFARNNDLCMIDQYSGDDWRGDLLISDHPVQNLELNDTPKQLVKMGAYIIVLPDKVWVNTAKFVGNEYEYGNIEAEYTSTGTVKYTPCRVDGTPYTNVTASATAPASPTDKQYWLDTSEKPHTLKQYSATQSMWVVIPTVYIRIQATNIAKDFAQYDGVKLSGMSCASATENAQLAELNGKYSVLQEVYHDSATPANDYIVVTGVLDSEVTQTTAMTAERDMPDMDFVIECNNRLWGCKFGRKSNGETINEIYASKLGDFKNWNCFMGVSTDSYAATVGSYGEFTGAISYSGYPLFFKERSMYKIFGSFPSNFQIQTVDCSGVHKGDARTLCVVDNILYYKAQDAIVAYDGSLPRNISGAFGSLTFNGKSSGSNAFLNGAVACGARHKYYINMRSDEDGKWYLFYYDTGLGLWYKEDSIFVSDMTMVNEELFMITDDGCAIRTEFGTRNYGDNVVVPMGQRPPLRKEPVSWSGVTGTFGLNLPDKKYISNIIIRLSADVGTDIKVFIQYDSSSEWKQVCHYVGKGLSSVSMPIRPRRCDHFRLRFVGVGDAKIYSIAQTIEQGSDY